MTGGTAHHPFSSLKDYLSACRTSFNKCIDVVTHNETINGLSVTTRLHWVRFDGNGQPMIPALCQCLYEHIIHYCIAAKNRPEPLTAQESARLTKEARKLFIHPAPTLKDPDQTGEAGELLLYFLIEAVLGAPQVVAKVELKTNHSMPVHGSDGIHMAWNATDNLVDIYFGEAKVYKDVGGAMTEALDSIDEFHKKGMCEHEFKLVTKQFKYVDGKLTDAVHKLLRDGQPSADVRINHACLIGYNWKEFANLNLASGNVATEFCQKYAKDAARLHGLLQTRFDTFQRKHLRFDVFLIPFKNIQEFRDEFNKALD